MRARLLTLLVVGLLLAPLPALAAPDFSAREEGAGWIEESAADLIAALANLLGKSTGSNEGDHGPTIDPDGIVSPPTQPAPATVRNRQGSSQPRNR